MKIYCPPAAINAKPVSHAWINIAILRVIVKYWNCTTGVQVADNSLHNCTSHTHCLLSLFALTFLPHLQEVIKSLLYVCMYKYVCKIPFSVHRWVCQGEVPLGNRGWISKKTNGAVEHTLQVHRQDVWGGKVSSLH